MANVYSAEGGPRLTSVLDNKKVANKLSELIHYDVEKLRKEKFVIEIKLRNPKTQHITCLYVSSLSELVGFNPKIYPMYHFEDFQNCL
jgi:hypothetical protein